MGMDLLDETQLECVFGTDVAAAQVVGDRTVVAEPAGEKPARTHLRDEPEPPEGGDEDGALGGDDDVAGKCLGELDTRRGAVQGGDEELVG